MGGRGDSIAKHGLPGAFQAPLTEPPRLPSVMLLNSAIFERSRCSRLAGWLERGRSSALALAEQARWIARFIAGLLKAGRTGAHRTASSQLLHVAWRSPGEPISGASCAAENPTRK